MNIVIRIYGFLLGLYPSEFRSEFREQMLLDFSDLLSDARKRGKFSILRFCLRVMSEIHLNLPRIYWREGHMVKLFRSQPLHSRLPYPTFSHWLDCKTNLPTLSHGWIIHE